MNHSDAQTRVLREQLRKELAAGKETNLVEQSGGAIPVIGRTQVCGGKVHQPTKILER